MRFIYREWGKLCTTLEKKGIHSISARAVFELSKEVKYCVLKHDVETNVKKAYKLAQIENAHGQCGTYYFQAYLMTEKNMQFIKAIAALGHEVSYHYDVMDSNKGDIEKAIVEFEQNKRIFEENGFEIKTVCQHGNPIVERVGYNSNRDFFRSEKVQKLYPQISDIMVDFYKKANTDYTYISDAGMGFKVVFDPINNDIAPSSEKDVSLKDVDAVLDYIEKGNGSFFISTHPHRWTVTVTQSVIKRFIFKAVRAIVKVLCKISFIRKFMAKHYHLAKKL